jgi:hypothetical protein
VVLLSSHFDSRALPGRFILHDPGSDRTRGLRHLTLIVRRRLSNRGSATDGLTLFAL